MPTYVYRCRACEHEFEHLEKITSRRKTRRCPACGDRAERQISGGAGFLFKGEGFYITDYRSEEYRSKQKAESGKDESPGKEAGKDTGNAPKDDASAKPADKPAAAKKRRGGAKKKKS